MAGCDLDPLIGTCLAETYCVVRRLGEGGMGVVYEADHMRLPRRFAVKVLRGDRLAARTIELFKLEAENACRLRHRHIVDVIDYNVRPDGTPYIVMELLTGEDLGTRLGRRRLLSLTEAQTVLRQTASAMTAAHEAGIVHSDLKPSNLFLCQRGPSEDYLKVLDFGIARLAYAHTSLAGGGVAGTPWYMAPEQLSGLGLVDPRTDVWALGVIAFQMLSGRLPFEGAVGDVLAKIAGEDPQPLARFNRRLGPALDPVLRRALAKRPEGRHASVRALLEECVAAIQISAESADWDQRTPTGEWMIEEPTRNDIIEADTISNPSLVRAGGGPPGPPPPPRPELRRAERAPGRLAVYSDGYLGTTLDLSAVGALIQTSRRMTPGTAVAMTLAVPGTVGLLSLTARVVRLVELSRGAGANLAVEFEPAAETRAALEWYVAWVRGNRPFGWRVLAAPDGTVVPMFGSLTEFAELEPVLAALGDARGRVALNLRDLRRMNSVAVGSWIRFVVALGKHARVVLEECSVPFLETALLVPTLVFGTTVASFYLPSYCPGCGEEEGHLVQAEGDLTPAGDLAPGVAERSHCFNCGTAVVFDDFSRSLLAVVRDTRR
ncbi:MAG TPA: serine/threonine-protein kinase [Polyangia bacterium]|jgi:serine/threonine protein kinase